MDACQSLNIAIVGGGMMAQVGHLPFYANNPRVNLWGVVEERPSLQSAIAEKIGAEKIFSNREDVLQSPDVHAIVLSAPRPATGPLSLEILQAGKHLLAEKPMAHTADQAQKLVDASKSNNCTYMVGYMKLYDPGVRAAKQFIDNAIANGNLGELISARFYSFSKSYAVAVPPHTRPQESRTERYPVWPTFPDWLDESHRDTYAWYLNAISHNVNLLQHFLSDVEVKRTMLCGTNAVTTLFDAGGVPVTLDVGKTNAGRWVEGAEFNFENGRVELTIPSPMATNEVAKVSVDDPDAGWSKKELDTGSGWCFAMQAKAFIDVLLGDTDAFLSPGELALSDMVLIENVWKNLKG